MKRQIRRKVFETNSSSVHSITVSLEGLEKSNLPMDDNGYITVDYGNFGCEYEVFDTQEEKLSYLVSLAYYTSTTGDIRNSDNFIMIENAICKYVNGAVGIKISNYYSEPSIDHQSIPDGEDINFINIYDENEIINFVFNKYIQLKTSRD